MMNRFRFTKVGDVTSPTRANSGDAGLDFYMPKDLTFLQLNEANKHAEGIKLVSVDCIDTEFNEESGMVLVDTDSDGYIKDLTVLPHSRVLIPSGIRGLLEPKDSMLMAANKSGISTKRGLIFSAEIVDSPYTGEIHIGLINTGSKPVKILSGEKLVQFIHVPVYQTTPEEIGINEYNALAENWGTRGSKGFGSSDHDPKKPYDPETIDQEIHY